MASSLLALLDDIATTLDDIAVLTKVAAKKTTGVLGDDLALNAEQVSGVSAERELPVVWGVAKGSVINKIILVPSALLISATVPWLIKPLLMLGGAFLCFEGVEKLFEKAFHKPDESHTTKNEVSIDDQLNKLNHDQLLLLENEKIKGAIRTDFILSAEIVVITLGTVAAESLVKQFLVLAGIASIMTVGVYGLVAGIVKLDDLGLYLARQRSQYKIKIGKAILSFAPVLMKSLGIVGTLAMFLVGGGIFTHNISAIHHFNESLPIVYSTGVDLFVGICVGSISLLVIMLSKKIKSYF